MESANKAPYLRQQRHHARALEFFSFSTARNNRDFVIVMINWKWSFLPSNPV